MKKQLIAIAVCGAFCGIAQADGPSVSVYGIIDVGVVEQSKAPNPQSGNPTNTGSVLKFTDAQIDPSIYGLKGSEDIGNGLKVGFTLEGGFNTGNGGFNSSNGSLFGRQANLTIGGDWGTVTGGLQFDPAFVAAIATEPRGMTDSMSNVGLWIIATLANTPTILQGGLFDANSISYSYAGNGLFVGVLYGFGGVAGSTEANSQTSIGASYTNSGATISAGWVQDKANVNQGLPTYYTGNSSEIYFVGLGYAMGPFAGRVQYNEFKFSYCAAAPCGTAGDDIKDWGIGFDWKAGANTLNLSYYNAKDDGAGLGGKTQEWALLDTYALSKRTSVYGQIGSLKADQITATSGPGASVNLGGAGIYLPANATPGATSTIVGLGMQHSF